MDIQRDENDPIVEWMEFLDAKSKGVIEMLAEKNKDIKKAPKVIIFGGDNSYTGIIGRY